MSKFPHLTRLDDYGQAFFYQQLTAIQTRTYDVEYPALNARRFIPETSYASPGDEFIQWYTYAPVGMAKVIGSYADDLPRVDIQGQSNITNIKSLGASFGYSIQEIRRAQTAGLNLEQRKANAARLAHEQLQNRLSWFGDAFYNIPGLITDANIPHYTAAVGAGGSTQWSTKTPDEILADLNNLVNGIMVLTNYVEMPDTLLIAAEAYSYITNTARSNVSDTTILQFFLDNTQYIREVYPVWELNGAGPAGSNLALAYNRSTDKLGMEVPVPFEMLPPQERNMEIVVCTHSRFAGTIVYYPLSAAILEGI
jgi:hypothetical protein